MKWMKHIAKSYLISDETLIIKYWIGYRYERRGKASRVKRVKIKEIINRHNQKTNNL